MPKRLFLGVEESLHRELKIEASKRGLSLTEFCISLIRAGMNKPVVVGAERLLDRMSAFIDRVHEVSRRDLQRRFGFSKEAMDDLMDSLAKRGYQVGLFRIGPDLRPIKCIRVRPDHPWAQELNRKARLIQKRMSINEGNDDVEIEPA